jgi:hypothetical protein
MTPFTEEEHEIIYHAAMVALSNVTTFDKVAEWLDINDDELMELHGKLEDYFCGED